MRPYALALVAAAGVTLPAVAFASNGADDPPGDDRTTTTTQSTATTMSTPTTSAPSVRRPSRGLTAAERLRAVGAAQARVGTPTTVVRVERKRSGGGVTFDVRLRDKTFRYRVRLGRDFGVVRVQRERLRAVAGSSTTTKAPAATPHGDDDGTADQGRGDAPGTASGDDDGTADQGRGDDRVSEDDSRGGGGDDDDRGDGDDDRGDDDDSRHDGSGGHGSDD